MRAVATVAALWASPAVAADAWVEVQPPWEDAHAIGVGPEGRLLVVADDAVFEHVPSADPRTPARFREVPGHAVEHAAKTVVVDGTYDVWSASLRSITRFRAGAAERFELEEAHLRGIAFLGPDEGWGAGLFGHVYRWDGRVWAPFRDEAVPIETGVHVATVGAFASDDVWFAGTGIPLLHWDGERLQPVDAGFDRSWIGKGGICPVGDDGVLVATSPVKLRDAGTWRELPDIAGTACAVDGEGRTWIGGSGGFIGVLAGGEVVRSPTAALGMVDQLRFDGAGTGWALARGRLLQQRPAPVVFTDRAAAAGLNDAGALQRVLPLHQGPIPDLLLLSADAAPRLLRNEGDWQFTDATAGSGLEHRPWPTGTAAACDLDNDGDPDLVSVTVTDSGARRLDYRRNQSGVFVDTGALGGISGVELEALIPRVDCVDLDADGDLDVVFTVFNHFDTSTLPNVVFEGDGTGRMRRVDVADTALGAGRQWKRASVFVDLWGDRRPEILSVARWNRGHVLLESTVDRWQARGPEAGAPTHYAGGVGGWAGDLDGDDLDDVVLLDDTVRPQLLLNDGARLVEAPTRDLEPLLRGMDRYDHGGGGLADLDGDGRLDVIGRDLKDGAVVLLQEQRLRFVDRSRESGARAGAADVVTVIDLDGDGDPDLHLGRDRAPDSALENRRAPSTVRLHVRVGDATAAGAVVVGSGGRRVVPADGGPVVFPAGGAGDPLRIVLTDGRVLDARMPGPGTHVLRPGSRARAELQRRLAWVRPAEASARVGLSFALLLAAVALGRRRELLRFGRLAAPLGLGVAVLATEPLAVEATLATRRLAGGVWWVLIPALLVLDLRATRLRRATWIGPFRLERSLGRGGMGDVHLAWDTEHQRRVALKILLPKLEQDPSARARFEREAEVGASFDDPHLVRVHASGECRVFEGDTPRRTRYLAMEFVDGGSLADCLEGAGPVSVGQAARVGLELLRGLGTLHAAGVIHRDVKPDNVLLTGDGRLKLTDFGLARGARAATLTRTGDIVGTIAYMSPEQAQGVRALTHASDLYSVGVLLFRLLAGRLPFVHEDPLAVLYQLITEDAPDLAALRVGLPDPLVEAVRRAMAKDPAGRWTSAGEFAAALAPFADAEVRPRSLRAASSRASTAPTEPAAPSGGMPRGIESTADVPGPPSTDPMGDTAEVPPEQLDAFVDRVTRTLPGGVTVEALIEALEKRGTLLLALGLLIAGCSPGPEPEWASASLAPPYLPEVTRGAWPVPAPDRLVPLEQHGGPAGAVLETPDALWIPTGYGVRRLPRDAGRDLEIATPGWARALVPVGDALWVLDDRQGVSVVRDGAWSGELRIEDIADLAAGDRVFAIRRGGELLTLAPGPDGLPTIVHRVLLGGTPWDLAVDGDRWAVAAGDAGVYWGRGARVEGRDRTVGARRVALTPKGFLAATRTGALFGPALDAPAAPLPFGPVAIEPSAEPWLLTPRGGLFRGPTAEGTAPTPRFQPEPEAGDAVGLARGASGWWVSMAGGVLLLIDDLGVLQETVPVSTGWQVDRVTPGWMLASARPRVRVVKHRRSGAHLLMHTDDTLADEAGPDRLLVAAASLGLVEVSYRGRLVPRVVRAEAAGDVAVDAEDVWIGGSEEGLVRWNGEVRRRWRRDRHADFATVALSDRWVVGSSYLGGFAVALRRGAEAEVTALLPGSPVGTAVVGDVGFAGLGMAGAVAAFPLDAGALPRPEVLWLPVPVGAPGYPGMLCPTDDGVLMMLMEYGVAVVRAEGARLRLDRIVQTPGRATDCAPADAPDTWIIADGASLLEVVLSGTRAAP